MSHQLACVTNQTVTYRLDIGAVIADEHDQQAVLPARLVQGPDFSVHARQAEVRGRPAEIAHRGFSTHHSLSSFERVNDE